MQQGPPSGDVFETQVTTRVGAQSVDASRVQIERAIPDPLTGGGLRAATATISATVGNDASEYTPTPWDPGAWPPAPETPARVEVDMGPGAVQSITGRVSSVTGGIASREVDVEVADLYQTLDRPISWDELSVQMPHPDEGEDQRFSSLHSMSVTNEIFRHCGWYVTPPLIPFSVLSVPAVGTMWPERGTLRTCVVYQNPGTGVYPYFHTTEWGLTVANVDARYDLATPYTLQSRGRMELAAITRAMDGRTNMALVVSPSGSNGVRLLWTGSTIFLSAADASGNLQTVVSVPRVDDLAYAKIDYISPTRIRGTLTNAEGVTATAEATVESAVTTGAYIAARIYGDQRGAGFQVAFPSAFSSNTLDGWKRNAYIHRWWQEPTILQVRPPVTGENCADLLDQQCAAEAATYWIDEHGNLQWWHLQELERQSNVATLNSQDHITDITWSHDLSSVKSRVMVKWTDLAVDHSKWSRVTLWESRDSTMADGDEVEAFINVPDEEVWIQPDLAFTRIGDAAGTGGGTISDFNRGRRSWWGAVLQNSGEWAYGAGTGHGSLTMTIERITGATFKYVLRRIGTTDAELRTPDATVTSTVSRNKRSMSLPILRGKMRYMLTEMEYTAEQTGPATAPELVVDAGWWLQSEALAKRTADYYAARCTTPEPTVASVDVVPFPGLQVGDIITLVDSSVSRLTIRGLVFSDTRSFTEDRADTHRIGIRPLAVSRNGATWEEWGTFIAGATWQAWGASQAGKTWAQWGSAPLQS